MLRFVFVLSLMAICLPQAMAETWPGATWKSTTPQKAGMDEKSLAEAKKYAEKFGGSGMIIRGGELVLSWGDVAKRYDLKSSSKGIGITALGIAIGDGKVKLRDKAFSIHPQIAKSKDEQQVAWRKEITLFHLATQTAGFAKRGGYTDLQFRPGTGWLYSDGGPNWLAECLTLKYGKDIEDVLFDRVFTKMGIGRADLRWRNNSYRSRKINNVDRREFGSGVHANVNAMARIGLLYLRNGRWKDEQILPKEFVRIVGATPKELRDLPEHKSQKPFGNASAHYGLLWWNNADGSLKGVPRDASWCWGLYDSLIVVIPSLDLVVARTSNRKSWPRRKNGEHYSAIAPFLQAIAGSIKTDTSHLPPKRKGSRILGVEWSPKAKIVRYAKGSDNWPCTWGDDGQIYTAYGDGRGFKPGVEKKLSIGICRVEGSPPKIKGVNVRAASIERTGGGKSGPKASGMLMVDGVLYCLLRNTGNAQIASSKDRGKTWTWADWKFRDSFGCPTFVNFGKNYAGARDDFVYVVSQDSNSAYRASNHTVLARVPKAKILTLSAYRFFAGTDDAGRPRWSKSVEDRKPILATRGKCYRTSVTWNPGLARYLLVQTPGGDTRFRGGFAVHEAAEPWGPWREVFRTEKWDVGPGESASFPAKWISRDGREAWLVFSGNDAFSLRKVVFRVEEK